MSRRFGSLWAGLLALAAAGGPWAPAAPAQQAAAVAEAPATTGLSVARIFGTEDFSGESFRGHWHPDARGWTVVEPDSAGRDELWRVEVEDGTRQRLIAAAELVPPEGAKSISIEDHALSDDGRRVLLFTDSERVWRQNTRGIYWVFDLRTRTLRPLSDRPGKQMFAKFSPDGGRVAFVRDNDLWLTDLESGEERRLTFDGSETIINGTTDWVYEEELSLRDAFRWSPDGRRIAYWRFDQSPVRTFHLVDETTLYPTLVPIRYPKAGEPNSLVRVGALALETGRTTWFETGPAEESYLARMEWAESSEEVLIQRLNRHQNRLELLLGDARSGAVRPVLVEADSAWVDVHDELAWVDGGRRFLWPSERDGWRHVYLYERDGTLVRQVTRGAWDVTELHGADEAGPVYFTAAAGSPLVRSVHAVPLRGGEPITLAGGRGVHVADFSPDFRFFLDRHSTISTPPRTTLRKADGTEMRTVVENGELAARLDSLGLREPEFLTVRGADGTPLNAWIMKPPEFDPTRAYPLLLYVYGGPGSQTVTDAWAGRRYLWHQMLVGSGVLVASVDNRGTGARGRAFRKQVYLRLGQLEAADQIAAARELRAHPYVDPERLALWGWSYGGYMTLLGLLTGGDVFTAGVSVAPVTAWELYDTIYTERYMRTPAENPEGYQEGAPLTHAARLEAELLLVHGTGDDNVHPQNTTVMVQALEEANRQFEMRLYPNKTHALPGKTTQVNLFEMITGFLLQELGVGGERAAS